MIRFAEQNAAGSKIFGAGTRYARCLVGSSLCSDASEIGANPYMIAVDAVTTPTSSFQLLNGPNARQPMTAPNRIDTTGTPFLFVLDSVLGISRSLPSAYDRRAVVPT